MDSLAATQSYLASLLPPSASPHLPPLPALASASSLLRTQPPPSSSPSLSGVASDAACLPLAAESESGPVEYKWKLLNKSTLRLSHLTTQMKWRLHEGGGRCRYELGVLDNGQPEGLSEEEMRETLQTIARMARELGGELRLLKVARGRRGDVAEVEVTEGGGRSGWVDVRVAVCGREQSGKSSLVGVLCSGLRDNGRGSARLRVFRHRHEVESGYTQSLSSQLLGFDSAGRVINSASTSPSPSSFASHSWASITDRACKIVTFSDLVGHESGQKVTIAALLSEAVDYALLVVSAPAGLTGMDRESIAVCEGLSIRLIVAVTKTDIAAPEQTQTIVSEIDALTASGGHSRIALVRSQPDVDAVIAAMTAAAAATSAGTAAACSSSSSLSVSASASSGCAIPVFTLSSVSGLCMDLFSSFLCVLPPHRDWSPALLSPPHFSIDSIFLVDAASVVGGVVLTGALQVGQRLMLGPAGRDGSWHPVTVASIHCKRRDVRSVQAGECASLGLELSESGLSHALLRRGLSLLPPSSPLQSCCWTFDAAIAMAQPPQPLHPYYQPIIYLPNIRQSAMLLHAQPAQPEPEGEEAAAAAAAAEAAAPAPAARRLYAMRFRWCYYPELVREGDRLVLREGQTRGVGRVTRVFHRQREEGGGAAAAAAADSEREEKEADGGAQDGCGRRRSDGCVLLERRRSRGERRRQRGDARQAVQAGGGAGGAADSLEDGPLLIVAGFPSFDSPSPLSAVPPSPLCLPQPQPHSISHSASLPHFSRHAGHGSNGSSSTGAVAETGSERPVMLLPASTAEQEEHS